MNIQMTLTDIPNSEINLDRETFDFFGLPDQWS